MRRIVGQLESVRIGQRQILSRHAAREQRRHHDEPDPSACAIHHECHLLGVLGRSGRHVFQVLIVTDDV